VPPGLITTLPTPVQRSTTPTLTPPAGHTDQPTLSPPSGASGQPTLTPPPGATGQPTLTPPAGHTNQPTLSPPSGASGQPTLTPPPGATGQPTTVGSTPTQTPPYICIPGWTPFMNVDLPTVTNSWETKGTGDVEPISVLRQHFSFCGQPTGIQCRSAVDGIPYINTLDLETVCTIEKGFECLNSKQGGYDCGDYEVSFNCDCGSMYHVKKCTNIFLTFCCKLFILIMFLQVSY